MKYSFDLFDVKVAVINKTDDGGIGCLCTLSVYAPERSGSIIFGASRPYM